MVAAPYKALLVFAFGSPTSGNRISYACTASDVAAASYVFQSGATDMVLPSVYGDAYLVDVQLSAAGTDTSTSDIYVGDRSTSYIVQNSANLASNLARQFLSAPMRIPPGARIKFTQRT
jgi:hypothetical protein